MYELLMASLMVIPGGEVAGRVVLTAVATEQVRRLGHPTYRVREAAGRELVRLGPAAIGPLQAGTAGRDAERARRCRDVLGQIEAADREAKLARLVEDPKAAPPDGLPLVAEFLKVAGDGAAARELYASLCRENGPALRTLQADPASTAAFEHACDRLRRLRRADARELGKTEFAWVCFLASRARPELVDGAVADGLTSAWCSRGAADLLRRATPGSPLRRLFLSALECQRNRRIFGPGTRLVHEARMREAVPVLVRILADPDTKGDSRMAGLAILPAIGDRSTARALRAHPALFEDKSDFSVTQFPKDYGLPPVRNEPRDVALGVCAELEGRDLDELGFRFLSASRIAWGSEPTTCKYAFLDDASRAAAFEKWKKLPPPNPK